MVRSQYMQESSVTDVACAALNGLKMGDKTLTVRRATARWEFCLILLLLSACGFQLAYCAGPFSCGYSLCNA